MTKQDEKKFAYCMAALKEAFGQEVSEMKIEIYFKALSDVSIEDIEKAVWSIINNRGTATFPKVAEIREAITGSPDDVAQIALSRLEDALNGHRGTGSVKFADKVIHMAVTRMGGWIELSDIIDRGEWKFRRSEFIRLYKACLICPCEYPNILEGSHRVNALAQGYDFERVRELGWSENRIRAVLGYVDMDKPGLPMIESMNEQVKSLTA